MAWAHFDVHQFAAQKTKGVGVLKHIMCVAANMSHVKRLRKATLSLIVKASIVILSLRFLQYKINDVMKQSERQLSHERTHPQRTIVLSQGDTVPTLIRGTIILDA